MNINNVSKREVLDYKDFRDMVHDDTFKPLSSENQRDSSDKTGLNKIKREPAYDFAGYADAVFGKESSIQVPGYNSENGRNYSNDNEGQSIKNSPNSITMTESEKTITSLKNFG
jgi:hypothetical protein